MCVHALLSEFAYAELIGPERFNLLYGEADMRHLARLIKNEDGATAIEYGLIASLIAVAIVAALQLLGPKLSSTFGTVTSSLN